MIVSVHYKFIIQTSGEIAWAVKKGFCVYIDVELFGWTRTFMQSKPTSIIRYRRYSSMTCFQIYLLIKNFVITVYFQVSVSLLAANICLSSGPETRTHTTYTACKQHFCIFLCVWFLHSSFCLCRVVLLPSVCAMASDVSKSGALKQSWRASAFASLQEFLAKFAPEIVQLQKKDLRSVANSSQSNKHAEWKQARNFFLRHFDFLPLEEKALLQDWELVLCDVSSLESVALLSGLQRCFERVDAFFKEHLSC